MTFSKPAWLLVLLVLVAQMPAQAGLGQAQSSIETERVRMRARHAVTRAPQYTLHDLQMADGSHLQQYVAANGQVFAVRWNTLHKPDLSGLLGNAFASYTGAVQQAALRGGIQRQFRHQGLDLVVQSGGHLQVFSGYAYRPSLLPPGFEPPMLGPR
jgi:hypothetical protein